MPKSDTLWHTCYMSTDQTTIKVTKVVRERITRASRTEHQSANEFLNQLVADWERKQRMAAVTLAMRNTSRGDMESYQKESAEWETTNLDCLAGYA